jgi:hypothetical protein
MNFAQLPISRMKVLKLALMLIAAGVFTYFEWPKYHDNANAILVVVTVFSVLAGFMITIIAISGDGSAIRGKNSRESKVHLLLIKKDLHNHRNMFFLYLVILSLAFAASMNQSPLYPNWQKVCEAVVLFLSCFAMLWSFSLPGYVMRRHIEDLDRKIREQREDERQLR